MSKAGFGLRARVTVHNSHFHPRFTLKITTMTQVSCLVVSNEGALPPMTALRAKEWLKQVFSSQAGTVMIEQSAKVLRDHETRDCTSNMLQHLAAWEALLNSRLIDEFGLNEIDEGVAAGTPPPSFGERLFVPSLGHNEKGSKLDLAAILKQPTWVSYSAQSQKLGYGQMEAVRYLHLHNMWGSAEDLWHTKLLIEGSIIHHLPSDRILLVLQVLEVSAICWPVIRVAHDMFDLDLGAKKLEWVHLFSVNEAQALCVSVLEVPPGVRVAAGSLVSLGYAWGPSCHTGCVHRAKSSISVFLILGRITLGSCSRGVALLHTCLGCRAFV